MPALAAPTVVALLAPLPADLTAGLQAAGHRVLQAGADDAAFAEAEIAVTRGSLITGESTFARLPRLRLLCCWGSGHDAIDLAAAGRRGIAVCNSPGGNSASVADLAMGFVIALLRDVPLAERHLRQGHWQDPSLRLPVARGLADARLGLYGYGEVGRRVAHRARAFDMQIGVCTRRPPTEPDVQVFADLAALATWCDVLVLAVRADASTHHAVNATVLAALRPDACLVNVARGSVIDEAALSDALRQGRIAGYASDVFEHEPRVPEAVLQSPNTVLTPHIGGATAQATRASVAMVLANIGHFLATSEPVHRVA
jgi:hydroxypyruvate reductase